MFGNLEVFTLAHRSAAHAGLRQAVVSENIANADTPRYRGRDIPRFSELWEDRGHSFATKTTRSGHFGQASSSQSLDELAFRRNAPEKPNGNSVTLEEELMYAVEVSRQHNRAISVYRSALTMLKTAVQNT